MKSKKNKKDDDTGKAACLARNFYKKNISLEMSSTEVVYEPKAPIVTSNGVYNTIKVVEVTKQSEVTCTARLSNGNFTANSTSPGTVLWNHQSSFLEAVTFAGLPANKHAPCMPSRSGKEV